MADKEKQARRNIMMSDKLWAYAQQLAKKEETSVSAILRRGLKLLAQVERRRQARA
jgi:hypothetical protein